MKKLFFFIFPLAFLLGFMPFFFDSEEDVYQANASQYTESKQDDSIKNGYKFDIGYQYVETTEPDIAQLLNVYLPYGYIDSATFVLPEGINFI